MTLSGLNILIVSPEPWEHLFVSKHHYGIELASRQNRVYYLNPPGSSERKATTEYPNLYSIDYKGFVLGQRFLPTIISSLITRNVFKKLERQCGVNFDIIWNFDSSVFYELQTLPANILKIAHLVDFNQDHQLKKMVRGSDICFCTTSFIKEKLQKYSNKVYLINHGFMGFGIGNDNFEIPQGGGAIKTGYAGNLDIQYMDWGLIERAVNEFQNIDFYFAGTCNNSDRLSWFQEHQNCFYLGELAHKSLPDFYAQMDFLYLAYIADNYKEQLANPHKMMQYLASGRPILSTYSHEYRDLKELISMSHFNVDWPSLFRGMVENFVYWDSEKLRKERMDYAADNTYSKQVDRIEVLLDSLKK